MKKFLMYSGVVFWIVLFFAIFTSKDPDKEKPEPVTETTLKPSQDAPPAAKKEPAPAPKPKTAKPMPVKKAMFDNYSVLRDRVHSSGKRLRILMDVKAPEAKTEREEIEAMMSSIVKRHRKDWPHVVSAFLRYSDDLDTNAKNRITYALDGCGWSGEDCTGEIWTQLMQGEMPADLTNWGEPTKAETEAGKEHICRNDLKCWGYRHRGDAISTCTPLIEGMAKYTYKWTGSKFESFTWKDRIAGTVAYQGNKIRFQNGFSAWQNMSYWCIYNPATKTAEAEVY